MLRATIVALTVSLTAGCIALPVDDKNYQTRCEISSDMKTLKVFNLAKESHSYYSVQGLILTPIILPTSVILSGSYMLVNNVYYLGKEKLFCSKKIEKNAELNQD